MISCIYFENPLGPSSNLMFSNQRTPYRMERGPLALDRSHHQTQNGVPWETLRMYVTIYLFFVVQHNHRDSRRGDACVRACVFSVRLSQCAIYVSVRHITQATGRQGRAKPAKTAPAKRKQSLSVSDPVFVQPQEISQTR